MKIGFIGCGNMARAMIGGILGEGLVKKEEILASDKGEEVLLSASEKLGIVTCKDNCKVAMEADVLFLAVKPIFYEQVIREIRGSVKENCMVVSIAPGKTLEWIGKCFERELLLVRAMPNTPALVGEGMAGICYGDKVGKEQKELIVRLFSSFGKCREVEEGLMDAVVSVSGSAPAYVFMMIEAMADAAVADGLSRDAAYTFASQAVLGSAKMVLETGCHPAALKDMVCSPAGTTIEAVRVLEERGFRSSIMEAMKVCTQKAKKS